MKRIALLSCSLLALFCLANAGPAAAQPCQTSAVPALDLQALTAPATPATPASPTLPATQAHPGSPALPSDPVDGRTDRVCFWYPTGQCCAGGFQIEEWICDPSLTRCGPRTC
jgi:hypothetical protein